MFSETASVTSLRDWLMCVRFDRFVLGCDLGMIRAMKFIRLILFACVVVCAVLCAHVSSAQTGAPALPDPTGFVNDYAEVIDPATQARLETILKNLQQRADIQLAVVTVPTTGEVAAFDYTLQLARKWGIGPAGGEQKGLILLVAVNDRKFQIQPSRHLQGDLPDGLVGAIGREMRDPFRRGDFSGGIAGAVETLVATLAEKRGFSIDGIDRSRALRGSQPARRASGGGGFGLGTCCFMLVILFILLAVFGKSGGGGGGSNFRGGGFGGGGSGLMNALLVGSVLNSMGRGGSSGWGSGGGFGSGSGSGGGFGGFGGGGDFNGGGAGGEW